MSEFKQCGTQAQQMSSSSGGSAAIEDTRPAVQQQERSTVSKLSASHAGTPLSSSMREWVYCAGQVVASRRMNQSR